MDAVAFSMSNTEVTHLEWTYLLSLLREMQLVSIKQGCAFAGIVYINSHTLYYLKAESYALQAVASIEEPCTHMLLSCMIEVQPLEEVQCSSCLLFISTHIPRIIFFLTISHGTINHLSTIYDTILRAPKISLQTKARHPCFPLKKKALSKKVCSGKLVLSGNFISDSSQGLIHSTDTTSFGLRMLPCHLQGSLLVYWVLNRLSSRQDKGWDLN